MAQGVGGSLYEIFSRRSDDLPHSGKWKHYFEIYERHLSKFRNTNLTLVEIGVQNGGSVDVYRRYFGSGLKYVGIDINPKCKRIEGLYSAGVTIEIGDSGDVGFLKKVAADIGKADIVIDDGSHIPQHQRTSFDVLYEFLDTDHGVYIVEDLQTNFFPGYGGGRYSSATFLAYAKGLTDALHDHVYKDSYYQARLEGVLDKMIGKTREFLGKPRRRIPESLVSNRPPNDMERFTATTRSIHFYPYVIVFEKGPTKDIEEVCSGSRQLSSE